MGNKYLATFLQYQIDKKRNKITENNAENIDLRMECQHLESAIKIIVAKGRRHDG